MISSTGGAEPLRGYDIKSTGGAEPLRGYDI